MGINIDCVFLQSFRFNLRSFLFRSLSLLQREGRVANFTILQGEAARISAPNTTRKPSWRKGKRATALRVMKAPSEEIYSKSTIRNFLLMVNSNRGRITYRLRDIFAFW